MSTPKGLRAEGAELYRSIAGAAREPDPITRDTLVRACKLADLAADLEADIAERGLTIGDRPNPSVLRLVQVQKAIASLTKMLAPPGVRTGHLNRKERNVLRDAARNARSYG